MWISLRGGVEKGYEMTLKRQTTVEDTYYAQEKLIRAFQLKNRLLDGMGVLIVLATAASYFGLVAYALWGL